MSSEPDVDTPSEPERVESPAVSRTTTARGRIPRRLWLRWTALLLFVVLVVTAFIQLGEWQLRRLDQRRATNATVAANAASAPKPYTEVFTHPITDADQWQRVTLSGTFDAEHQFQVRYRSNGGSSSFEVVTPLRTDSGEAVLVDRGFIPVPQGSKIPEALPAPPSGPVTVTGHVRRSEIGKPKATNPRNGTIRLVNAPAIGASLPYPVLDGYVGALEMTPPQAGGFQPVPLPDSTEGPHLSYALQWFFFTTIAVAGLVVFIRGDLIERRKERLRSADGAQAPAGAPAKPKKSATQKARKQKKVRLDPLGRPIDPTGPVRPDPAPSGPSSGTGRSDPVLDDAEADNSPR